MNLNNSLKYAVATLMAFLMTADVIAAELSAEEIMRRVDERYDGDTSVANSTMVLIDRRERQRVRQLRNYSKDYGDDTRTLSFFESPADISGTSYLNYDWDEESQDDDSWLYLPALQQVKRIASSDKSDSFMGSDFTYSDINGLEFSWYDYSFLNESEMVDGHDCWVIEVVPKPEFKEKAEESTGNLKSHVWIRKDAFLMVKSKIWVKRGNRVKYFTASDIEQIDGIWTAKRLQMVTTRNDRREHASILQLSDIVYNEPIHDDVFTTDTMQRGSLP